MSRKILSISVFALLCLTSAGAQAAGGCGRGEHRGPDGRCYDNGGIVVERAAPVVVVAPAVSSADPAFAGTRDAIAAGRTKRTVQRTDRLTSEIEC